MILFFFRQGYFFELNQRLSLSLECFTNLLSESETFGCCKRLRQASPLLIYNLALLYLKVYLKMPPFSQPLFIRTSHSKLFDPGSFSIFAMVVDLDIPTESWPQP